MMKVQVDSNWLLRSYHSNALRTSLMVCIVPMRSLVLEDTVSWDLLNGNAYIRFARTDPLYLPPT